MNLSFSSMHSTRPSGVPEAAGPLNSVGSLLSPNDFVSTRNSSRGKVIASTQGSNFGISFGVRVVRSNHSLLEFERVVMGSYRRQSANRRYVSHRTTCARTSRSRESGHEKRADR